MYFNDIYFSSKGEFMQEGYIRYIGLRFNKTKLYNWAKRRYVEEETQADKRVREEYSKMKDISQLSPEEYAKIQNEFNFEPQYYLLMNMIEEFTLADSNFESINATASLFDGLASIMYDNNYFSLTAEDASFTAKKLSHEFPEIKKYLTDIEKPNRIGRCHPYSVVLVALLAKDNHGDNSCKISLATDRIYQLSHKAKILHSWVEVEIDGKVFVLDASKNLIIDKDAYYEICHVNEPEKVDSIQLLKDYKMIRRLTDYDEYLVKVYYENAANGRLLYKTLVEKGEILENAPASN